MIVQITGGMGFGKSTLVKLYMESMASKNAVYDDEQSKPIGYSLPNGIYVFGHYEINRGGVDTLYRFQTRMEVLDSVFQTAITQHDQTSSLFECIFMRYRHLKWIDKIRMRNIPYEVIALQCTLEQSLKNSEQRNGSLTTQMELEIRKRYLKSHDVTQMLLAEGVSVHLLEFSLAYLKLKELLPI